MADTVCCCVVAVVGVVVAQVLNALMQRDDFALHKVAVGTIPAGSECAFAKMTTFVEAFAACWVVLKGHCVSAIDVMRITQVSADTANTPQNTHTRPCTCNASLACVAVS